MNFPFWNTDLMSSQPDWLQMSSQPDWFQNQKQYMDAWSSFQNFMPNSSTGILPMAEAMNSWWKSASPSLSGQNHDFFSKMMQQCQSYYFMGDQFSNLMQGMNELNSQSEGWQSALNGQFESIKSIFEQSHTLQDTIPTIPFMEIDLQNDYLKVIELLTSSDKYTSIPGMGSNRESLEQMQEGMRLTKEYQLVSHEFNGLMNKVGVEALEVMRLMIIEMHERDEEINSLRQIYNLWVDCNEKAYAEYVYTDDYSELYGRLSNALMEVKQHYGKVIDQMLARLNLPTKKGTNSMLKRLQEMKRAQMRSAVKIKSMENEIQALRKLIEDGIKASSTVSKKASKKKAKKNTSSNKSIVVDI
jgi:class III poly(R)-hydroxyalkanoic acid synthase PhaE subunit